jgi:hypothetical protein
VIIYICTCFSLILNTPEIEHSRSSSTLTLRSIKLTAMCMDTRSPTLSVTLSVTLSSLLHEFAITRRPCSKSVLSNKSSPTIFAPFSAESEAREHASLGAFLLDTAENLSRCVNSLVALLPEDAPSNTTSSTTSSSSTTSTQLSSEGEGVNEKESRVINLGTSVDPTKVGLILFYLCLEKPFIPKRYVAKERERKETGLQPLPRSHNKSGRPHIFTPLGGNLKVDGGHRGAARSLKIRLPPQIIFYKCGHCLYTLFCVS